MNGRSLCWVCKKQIKGGLFSPSIITKEGWPASACDKCAGYRTKAVLDEDKRTLTIYTMPT